MQDAPSSPIAEPPPNAPPASGSPSRDAGGARGGGGGALPPSGDPGLDWAARTMPLLARSMTRLAPTFRGLHVGICLHIEPKTGVLVSWLLHVGARVTITGNLGTTNPVTAAALEKLGATVIGTHLDGEAQHQRNLDAVVAACPDIFLDNGAEMLDRIVDGAPRAPRFRGATEETTSGGRRLRERATSPDFPVIVINDSYLKLLVENEFGVGQSVVQGFMNATNFMLPAARALVIGYGPCGKGTAETLARLGARVCVVDTDPYRALEAVMRGHRVGTLEDLLPEAQVVFLATGHPNVIAEHHFPLLRDGVMLVGVGHDAYEANLDALRKTATRTQSLSVAGAPDDARIVHTLPSGREVVLLHGSKMINLVAALGNPIQAMDLGLTLQAASLAAIADGHAEFTGPHPVPESIDRRIAADLVELWC